MRNCKITPEFIIKVAIWLVFGFFAGYSILLLYKHSPNVAGVENNTIYFIQRLLDGQTLYTDPELPPYAIAQYGPLYYYLSAGFSWLAGSGSADVTQLFFLNRLFSIILILSAAGVVSYNAYAVFKLSAERAILLYAIVCIFFEISTYARADSLSLLFICLSIHFLTSYYQQNPKRLIDLILSACMAALAVFSKQSAVSVFIITSVWFLYKKELYRAFIYSTVCILALLTGVFLLYLRQPLSPVYKNVILGINNGINVSVYFNYIVHEFFARQGLTWILLSIPVVYLLGKSGETNRQYLAFLISGQFFFSSVAALKYGSSSNYFTEWWVFLLAGTALCWPFFLETCKKIHTWVLPAFILLLLFLRSTTLIQPVYMITALEQKKIRELTLKDEKKLVRLIRKRAGSDPFLVFNNIFSPDSYLNNLLYKEAVVPQNDIVVLGTYFRNIFNYDHLRIQLVNGEIRFLVLPITRKGFLEIPVSEYNLVDSTDSYCLFEHIRFKGMQKTTE